MKSQLIQLIRNVYDSHDLQDHFLNNDRSYLINAHCDIERIWQENFMNIEQVKYLLLSEAPLWGVNNSFIYHYSTSFTQFFYENDLLFALNRDLIHDSQESISVKKERFINTLNDLGIVIIDVSPYALNSTTAINYSRNDVDTLKLNPEEYRNLLSLSFEYYLSEKLRVVKEKINPNIALNIIYRYSRLYNLHQYVEPYLNNAFGENNFIVNYIGQRGGGINRNILRNILQNR
jgi:hypothetical protein